MNDNATYWLNMVDYDLETAKVMLDGGRYLYVGFMCHLSVEKAIKAVIAERDPQNVPPKIHNLIRLANLSGVAKKLTDEQKSFLEYTSTLHIEARYTDYKETIAQRLSANFCAELLEKTQVFIGWIKQQLPTA